MRLITAGIHSRITEQRMGQKKFYNLRILSLNHAQQILQLIRRMGLPVSARVKDPSRIWKAMAHDKKWVGTANRWVLPTGIGSAVVREQVPERVVRAAVKLVLEG